MFKMRLQRGLDLERIDCEEESKFVCQSELAGCTFVCHRSDRIGQRIAKADASQLATMKYL